MNKGKRWSKEEEILKENWDRIKLETLSKKLGRTEDAIKIRAKKLNLGLRRTGYTVSEVADIFGFGCPKTVTALIKSGKLKALESKIHNSKIYSIQERDIRHFAKNNPDLWDSRKLKINFWYDNEPSWLIEKIELDKDRPLKLKERYSKEDDKKIIQLFTQGMTRKEIAKIMNRSEKGISRRLGRLNYGIPK